MTACPNQNQDTLTRQQPASGWREVPEELQVFRKNVQKIDQKVVQKRVPENRQGLAKTLFSTTFLRFSKNVRTFAPPSPAP